MSADVKSCGYPINLDFKIWVDREGKKWLVATTFKTYHSRIVDGEAVRQVYVDIKCIDGFGAYCETTLLLKEYNDLPNAQWELKAFQQPTPNL